MRLIHLPREQVVTLEKAFRRTRNPTEQLRYQALLLLTKRFTRQQVCEIVGKSPRCVGEWVARYNKQGLKGLEQKGYLGNHRLLTNKQKAKIKQLITTNTPDELSFTGRFWNIPLLKQR